MGASSGSGRATAIALVRAGADVVFAARRTEALEDAVAEAGGGHVTRLDVTDGASIRDGVANAIDTLGGIDGLIYTAGMSPMAPLRAVTAAQWQALLTVNLVGPNLVIAEALPHLSDDAVVAVFSSDSAENPRHSLVPYAASKIALEATMKGWRAETLGGRRFVSIVLGPTYPTGFADDFDQEAFGEAIPHWQRQGVRTGILHADSVADHLVAAFDSFFTHPTFGVETMLLRAPEPAQPAVDLEAGTIVES
ncbi:MAG: SDR family oxidoreductase [Acidimicrobiales bacterium]